MNMKNLFLKILTLVLILISVSVSFGQFGVNGPKRKFASYCTGEHLVNEDYKKLKNSTLYFVCPEYISENIDELKVLLNEAWTYCPLEVIGAKDLEK